MKRLNQVAKMMNHTKIVSYEWLPIDDTINITEQKIEKFASFQSGWSVHGGEPFSGSTITLAKELNSWAIRNGFFKTGAFPGIHGNILVTVYYGKHCLELEIEEGGLISITHEKDGEDIDNVESLDLEGAKKSIEKFKEKVCISSGFLTKSISTGKKSDLEASHSSPQAGEGVYQLLVKNVLRPQKEPVYASTYESIIQDLPQNHPFFGSSIYKYCLPSH